MTSFNEKRDLIVLVADRNMEAAVSGILGRHASLNIRLITADILRHPEQDSGCRTGGVEFLSAFFNQYVHALLIFDREGSGATTKSAEEIEGELEGTLERPWGKNGAVIVIDPELENWVWSDSPQVDQILGWAGRKPDLRGWLTSDGFHFSDQNKPTRPKEALESALRVIRKPRSSAVYQSLAESVSLNRCTDRAFKKLKITLRQWFQEK